MSDIRPPGPTASLKALARTLLDVLRTRLELLAVEGTQYQQWLAKLALLAALGLLSLVLSVQLAIGLLLALLWDTPYRLPAVAALAVLFAVCAVASAAVVVRALRAAPSAFSGTRQALAADVAGIA